MKFEIGMKVKYKGEIHEVFDVDEGYEYLALDGDKYAYPDCETNDCISAPMAECILMIESTIVKREVVNND